MTATLNDWDIEDGAVPHEFFVVMLKRGDFVNADLHKTDGRIYLTIEDAEAALKAFPETAPSRHVVRMLAFVASENARPEHTDPDSVPTPTPAELRKMGVPYCPDCFTFGHDHSKSCKYRGASTLFHVARTPG